MSAPCSRSTEPTYPTVDGTAIRDFVHVSDLASAHVLALQYLLDGGDTTAINLGLGNGYSVRQVVAAVESVGRTEVPVKEGARRTGDPPELVADPHRAGQVLGWRPKYRDLEENRSYSLEMAFTMIPWCHPTWPQQIANVEPHLHPEDRRGGPQTRRRLLITRRAESLTAR